ncbi:MAG: hypothetical protein ACM3W4_01725 [Ignavibacteriales bacterium]
MSSGEKWTLDTPLKVGFHPPEQCVRGRSDCRSLAQIISDGDPPRNDPGRYTFMCCGERDPATITGERKDKWRLCHRSVMDRSHTAGVDIMFNVCRYDMSHLAAVLGMGLATVIPLDEVDRPSPKEIGGG